MAELVHKYNVVVNRIQQRHPGIDRITLIWRNADTGDVEGCLEISASTLDNTAHIEARKSPVTEKLGSAAVAFADGTFDLG